MNDVFGFLGVKRSQFLWNLRGCVGTFDSATKRHGSGLRSTVSNAMDCTAGERPSIGVYRSV